MYYNMQWRSQKKKKKFTSIYFFFLFQFSPAKNKALGHLLCPLTQHSNTKSAQPICRETPANASLLFLVSGDVWLYSKVLLMKSRWSWGKEKQIKRWWRRWDEKFIGWEKKKKKKKKKKIMKRSKEATWEWKIKERMWGAKRSGKEMSCEKGNVRK